MAKSPSSAAQHARETLAARLKEVMLRAGLDGVKVAAAAGWHASKSSRLLTATTLPSVNDIRVWCRVCGTTGPGRRPRGRDVHGRGRCTRRGSAANAEG
ncbi:helix-turn-helix domain-containing protein [Embleya sp. NPDC050154]|uniref:helix-turn-helix domain-containing protein n=1 Tax=unclassified Embleya TaxID=2699296 RepID=UPI0037A72E03